MSIVLDLIVSSILRFDVISLRLSFLSVAIISNCFSVISSLFMASLYSFPFIFLDRGISQRKMITNGDDLRTKRRRKLISGQCWRIWINQSRRIQVLECLKKWKVKFQIMFKDRITIEESISFTFKYSWFTNYNYLDTGDNFRHWYYN